MRRTGHSRDRGGFAARVAALIVAVAVAGWSLAPAAAAATTAASTTAAAATTTTATLSPTPAQPTFVATGAVLKFTAGNTWTTTIQVLNTGPATTVGLQVILLPQCVSLATATQVTLNPDGVTTIPLRFTGPDFSAAAMRSATVVMVPTAQTIPAARPCAAAQTPLTVNQAETVGSLAATPPAGATTGTYTPAPQVMNIPLARITPLYYGFVLPLVLGAVLAALVIAIIWWWVDRLLTRANQPVPERIKAGSTWNFKDSFATNATAIGGLLGAALSALGAGSTLLPGVETSRFSLLAALWATVAVLTPLLLSFGTRDDTAPLVNRHLRIAVGPAGETAPVATDDLRQPATSVSYPVLLACLFMTVLAAGAELTTFAVLASESATTHWIIYVVLTGFAVLIAAYVTRTSVTLITSQCDDNAPPHSGLNHFRDTSLIG